MAGRRPKGKLDPECFIYTVRKDQKKASRVQELLKFNDEVKEAKKVPHEEDDFVEQSREGEDGRDWEGSGGSGGGGGWKRRKGGKGRAGIR